MEGRYLIQWDCRTANQRHVREKYLKTYKGAINFYNQQKGKRCIVSIELIDTFNSDNVYIWKDIKSWHKKGVKII